jgi:clan AA aspartic protease (TIGR02281 family)
MRLLSIALILPLSALATDYYECVSTDGVKSYQIDRCSLGQAQQRILDTVAPMSMRVDRSGETMTTQVVKAGIHYRGTGYINGVSFPMLVDTGASFVAISREQAVAAGISMRGRRTQMITANGAVKGVITSARTVTFAGHEIKDVPVIVQTSGKPFPQVLLGMSYLRHFDVNMAGSVLSLTRK